MKNEHFGTKQESRHAARMKRKARADVRKLATEKPGIYRQMLPIKPRKRAEGD